MDLIKPTHNPLITVKKDEVADITLAFQLFNDDVPVDITGTTLTFAVFTPNRTSLNKPCTITDGGNGLFTVLLDADMYSLVGDYSAQVYWYNGTEVNITDKIYYESVLDIPI